MRKGFAHDSLLQEPRMNALPGAQDLGQVRQIRQAVVPLQAHCTTTTTATKDDDEQRKKKKATTPTEKEGGKTQAQACGLARGVSKTS